MGIGGGGVSRVPKPKNRVDVHYFFFWRLLYTPYIYTGMVLAKTKYNVHTRYDVSPRHYPLHALFISTDHCVSASNTSKIFIATVTLSRLHLVR